jgi:hypothetical protein
LVSISHARFQFQEVIFSQILTTEDTDNPRDGGGRMASGTAIESTEVLMH